jgi:hypothetical protein
LFGNIDCGEGQAMRLEKRIERLEAALIRESVILRFANGSTREIPGGDDYLLNLTVAVCWGKEDLSPEQQKHVEWIAECVGVTEPGGGRMTEIIRCCLAGPVRRIERDQIIVGEAR